MSASTTPGPGPGPAVPAPAIAPGSGRPRARSRPDPVIAARLTRGRDGDTGLVQVNRDGPAGHTGDRICVDRGLLVATAAAPDGGSRQAADPPSGAAW